MEEAVTGNADRQNIPQGDTAMSGLRHGRRRGDRERASGGGSLLLVPWFELWGSLDVVKKSTDPFFVFFISHSIIVIVMTER